MNGRDLTLGLVGALAVAGMAIRRGSRAVALPYAARPMGDDLYEVIEIRTGKRPDSGEGAWTEDEQDEVERVVERLNREALLGRLHRVGPSSDWANTAWELGRGRVLFEDDNDDLIVLRRHGDDDEGEIEELARYRTVAEAAEAFPEISGGAVKPKMAGSATRTGAGAQRRKAKARPAMILCPRCSGSGRVWVGTPTSDTRHPDTHYTTRSGWAACVCDNGQVQDRGLGLVAGLALGAAVKRGSRSTGGTYFHVTTIDGANAILRDGFRAGPGICGRGVYLWDSLRHAQEMANDEGEDAVILAVNPEDTKLHACTGAAVQREDDSDYYDHVVVVRAKSLWKPKMRVLK